MFYRVDYAVGVLCFGFLTGFLLARSAASVTASKLARGYYGATTLLVILRTVALVSAMLAAATSFWHTVAGAIGDLQGIFFGALFGLAARRKDSREMLTASPVLAGLCMSLAFTFALAGSSKAFSMAPMTEFFVQSGYSVTFLKFIVFAEILGGLGLLIPWALAPALIGLTIDMYGAVLTHIHNGDPLNDSTGAIGMLIRLLAVGFLWILRRGRDGHSPALRTSVVRVAAASLACFLVAFGGSIAVRHLTPPH
jgi:uncharacterized membrane protein YphA (DoxX/SURF4 family)